MAEPEHLSEWDTLLSTWRELDMPLNWRVEISDGTIRMTPPPAGPHGVGASVVHALLARGAPAGVDIHQHVGLELVELERMYIPDLMALPRPRLRFDGTTPPEGPLLVAEITSPSTARFDREEKRWAYARAGIPSYLLIDRVRTSGPVVALHTRPENGQYQNVVQVPYGEKLMLPPPFDVDLDTSEFPTDPC